MAELIPDAWRYNEEDTKCCNSTRRPTRRGPVTNILLWLDCFSTLATVLISKHEDKAQEFWAYQRTIIAAQRDYDGEAWVTYDACYRRQAAARKSLDWSRLDFGLFHQAFAGRAKRKNQCKHCLSEFHPSNECPLAPTPEPQRQAEPDRHKTRQGANTVEICQLYNNEKGNLCRYSRCRYIHVCLNKWCHGHHPHSECKSDSRWRQRSPVRPPTLPNLMQEAIQRTLDSIPSPTYHSLTNMLPQYCSFYTHSLHLRQCGVYISPKCGCR